MYYSVCKLESPRGWLMTGSINIGQHDTKMAIKMIIIISSSLNSQQDRRAKRTTANRNMEKLMITIPFTNWHFQILDRLLHSDVFPEPWKESKHCSYEDHYYSFNVWFYTTVICRRSPTTNISDNIVFTLCLRHGQCQKKGAEEGSARLPNSCSRGSFHTTVFSNQLMIVTWLIDMGHTENKRWSVFHSTWCM